ncbi:hypothetical protein ABZX98_32895 [Streptomyces sp. NPDC002992]|uniref:hypothetical protein n=1 Tax=Streptomyces sp. NPDC002992 TaxID=3154273 RepID=UPI0033B79E92
MSVDNPGGNADTPSDDRLPLRWLVIMIGSTASAGLAGAAAGVATGIGAELVVEPQNAVIAGITVGAAAALSTFVKTMQQLHQILGR